MKTGRDQADLYVEILDALGLDRVRVVGASEGGFIASNLALHAPHRVERVALLGPMGYAGSISTVLRIMFAQLVPLDSVRDKTFRWAFSDSPELEAEFGEWFRLLMKGVKPRKVPPLPLRAPDRQKISVPVLFVFGTKDHLVGDPETARERVQDMQDVRVEIVEAGHLMAAERPAEIDRLLLDFLAES
jgi:pimeloyl-ACP methyl ester carboxylesterase